MLIMLLYLTVIEVALFLVEPVSPKITASYNLASSLTNIQMCYCYANENLMARPVLPYPDHQIEPTTRAEN